MLIETVKDRNMDGQLASEAKINSCKGPKRSEVGIGMGHQSAFADHDQKPNIISFQTDTTQNICRYESLQAIYQHISSQRAAEQSFRVTQPHCV